VSPLQQALRLAEATDDAYPRRPRPARARLSSNAPLAWAIPRLLAFVATAFYVAAVIPFCPHIEAWTLHLGCVLSLSASWSVALQRRGAFSLRGLLFGLIALSVLCAGSQRATAFEAALDTDLWRLERERRFTVGPAYDWARLTVGELYGVAAERRDGWVRASVVGLDRLEDPLAHGGADLLETTLPTVDRGWYRLSILGEDRIGVLKARRAVENERRRRAEHARRRFLQLSATR